MTRPRLTRRQTWAVETSHMVKVPKNIESRDIEDLRRKVQEIADHKQVRVDRPPIGELTFKYHVAEDQSVTHVLAFFKGTAGTRRFMRLRRIG